MATTAFQTTRWMRYIATTTRTTSARNRFFHSTTTTLDSNTTLQQRYQKLVDQQVVHPDEQQLQALEALERFRQDLMVYKPPPLPTASSDTTSQETTTKSTSSWFGFGTSSTPEPSPPPSSLRSSTTAKRQQPRGVYLHGGVGCGKTMIMNLFYESLNDTPWKNDKQHVHFHKFMAGVHQAMHHARQQSIHKSSQQHVSDAVLPAVVTETARRGRVICLDEFQVTDVADALILQRLFTGLWQTQGCMVVATSNRAPSDLYLGGLQRDRFLPFIDVLQEYCEEVSLWDSAVDYRLIQKVESGQVDSLWFVGKQGRIELDRLFYDDLVGPRRAVHPVALQSSSDSQRMVKVPQASQLQGIARFSFEDVCQKAMGASDYLVIGQHFSTVVVDQIPTLTTNEINWVRRFILLVDALYESNVKLILHCQEAKHASDIFVVSDYEKEHSSHDEVFAFDRTVSRLQEMSSQSYLHRKWTRRSDKNLRTTQSAGLGVMVQPSVSDEKVAHE